MLNFMPGRNIAQLIRTDLLSQLLMHSGLPCSWQTPHGEQIHAGNI